MGVLNVAQTDYGYADEKNIVPTLDKPVELLKDWGTGKEYPNFYRGLKVGGFYDNTTDNADFVDGSDNYSGEYPGSYILPENKTLREAVLKTADLPGNVVSAIERSIDSALDKAAEWRKQRQEQLDSIKPMD